MALTAKRVRLVGIVFLGGGGGETEKEKGKEMNRKGEGEGRKFAGEMFNGGDLERGEEWKDDGGGEGDHGAHDCQVKLTKTIKLGRA